MLKNIPKSFTPELLKMLMETGHGDEILISDGNFPHKSMNAKNESVYIPTSDISELLKDILLFFPLDGYVESAAVAMDFLKEGPNFEKYEKLIEENGSKLKLVGRFEFYELAKSAAGIIVTADTTKGGNVLIKKGVV
ncbi:MAG: fucose isomerase [Oscillospiraceae bacterium]|nr:fucose isomerase [Oscillospiraceae bacterium]